MLSLGDELRDSSSLSAEDEGDWSLSSPSSSSADDERAGILSSPSGDTLRFGLRTLGGLTSVSGFSKDDPSIAPTWCSKVDNKN